MRKILYLSRSGQFGGMEKHILDLIKSVKNDFEIHIFCAQGPIAKEYEKNLAIVRYVVPKNSFDLSYMKKVRDYILNNKINIIHTHELEVSVLGLVSVANLNNVKKIMHIHTPITNWRHSFLAMLFKAPLNFIANFVVGNFIADKVIALTETIRKERVTKELINSSKVVLIPNSINVDEFNLDQDQKGIYKSYITSKYNIPDNKVIIGNLSRLTKEKGQDLLIYAFAEILKQNSNLHLVIAGGGQLSDLYNKLIITLGIENNCTVTGIFEETEKVRLYATFDYFVFPSLAEGFGYVLVEAMSAGLVILASDIQVLKDVSNNQVNFFKSGDVFDLTNKLLKLIDLKVNKDEMYNRYQKVLNNYTFVSFKNNYLELYKSFF